MNGERMKDGRLKYVLGLLVVAMIALAGCQTGEHAAKAAEAEEAAATQDSQAAEAKAAEAHAHRDGAAKSAKQAALAEDLKPGETGNYGADFSIDGAPITLADALSKVRAGDETPYYKVSGKIEQVCQKKGCWFTLTGEGVDEPVRVRMKDYGFFVPRNSSGAAVVVEGTLEQRTIPQAEAQHYAEDAAVGSGQPAAQVHEAQTVWEMTIVAAQVSDQG